MSRIRVASIVFLLSCLVPAVAMAVDGSSTGAGNKSYLTRCEIPFPDTYNYHSHYDPDWFTLSEAISHCRDLSTNLPYNWRNANFTIHFGPSLPSGDQWQAFTCRACVRYENGSGPWEGRPDIFTSMPQPIGPSINDAVALYGGRVSQVEFFASANEETGELAGGYEVTLVNVGTGLTGVVQIDPFTGQATVIREEPISAEQ